LDNPTYQYEDFEDEYEDEWMTYEKQRRFTNPNPNNRGDFLTQTGEANFLILIGEADLS